MKIPQPTSSNPSVIKKRSQSPKHSVGSVAEEIRRFVTVLCGTLILMKQIYINLDVFCCKETTIVGKGRLGWNIHFVNRLQTSMMGIVGALTEQLIFDLATSIYADIIAQGGHFYMKVSTTLAKTQFPSSCWAEMPREASCKIIIKCLYAIAKKNSIAAAFPERLLTKNGCDEFFLAESLAVQANIVVSEDEEENNPAAVPFEVASSSVVNHPIVAHLVPSSTGSTTTTAEPPTMEVLNRYSQAVLQRVHQDHPFPTTNK